MTSILNNIHQVKRLESQII